MTKEQAIELGTYVRTMRTSRRLSARQVAQHAGVDTAQVTRLERGEVTAPQATVLADIAELLRVPVNDLFVLAGYPTSRTLPTIGPYLHAKYPRLSDEATARILHILHQDLGGS